MMTRLLTLAAATLALVGLGTACGGTSASPATATAPAGGEATTAGEATTPHEAGSSTSAVARRTDPRRNGLEIAMGEWALQLETTVIRPGPVTVVISNRGKMSHGFEIEADEDSSGHGGDGDRHKVESRLLASGETIRLRLDLPEGVYKVECLVDGHDDLGMESLLEVRAGAPLVKTGAAVKPNAVAITGFAFRPAEMIVRAGQAVTWTNEDPAKHTVTEEGGGFTSNTLGRHGRFRMVFDRPGAYRYFCALHPEMKGTVVVKR